MPPHWLTVAGATSTPRVVVTFDTETQVKDRAGGQVLTLRCWDAIIRDRGDQAGQGGWCETFAGEVAGDLTDVLSSAAGVTGEAWAFAHNAGFDLTVTALPMIMVERGWEPDFINMNDETCLFILRRDGAKLIITDSWSWLRAGLEDVAADVNLRKVRLPENDGSLEAWHHRCAHDVRILDRAVCQLLDWWDAQGLGRFGVTGSSCGWRSLRAKVEPKLVLVGAEPPRTEFERSAIYGGRREVYRVGRVRGRWVEDWDLAAAHLTTLSAHPMPTTPLRLEGWSPPPSPLFAPPGIGAIAEVEVVTDKPCAPVRIGEDVWWPVGTFRTVLTSVELAEVQRDARSVRVIRCQWYRLTGALRPWGEWCLGLAGEPDEVVPRVVKRVAKGWGRAIPGRFAMRTSRLLSERPATSLGWNVELGHDLVSGQETETITYGGVERTYVRDVDGSDVAPAVLAFVEGHVRAEMARVLRARPAGNVLQVNTDGWWEVREGKGLSDAAEAVSAPYRAVRKAVSRDVTLIGPNHLDSKDDRRLAGIPRDTPRRLDGSFAWQDWPGLKWQLANSRPGEYLRPGREVMLNDHYCRRWVLDSGETIPVSCRLDDSGQNQLLPWSETPGRGPLDVLAAWQVPALHALRDA